MELKYVESKKKLKTHDDYITALLTGILSLKTLRGFHEQAIEIGILKEDQLSRADTILWDFERMIHLYTQQAASVLELLPDNFDLEVALEVLRDTEIKKAKALVRAPKVKPCDT